MKRKNEMKFCSRSFSFRFSPSSSTTAQLLVKVFKLQLIGREFQRNKIKKSTFAFFDNSINQLTSPWATDAIKCDANQCSNRQLQTRSSAQFKNLSQFFYCSINTKTCKILFSICILNFSCFSQSETGFLRTRLKNTAT